MLLDDRSAAPVARQSAQLVKVLFGEDTGIPPFPVAAHADDMLGIFTEQIEHRRYAPAPEPRLVGDLIKDTVTGVFQRIGAEHDAMTDTEIRTAVDDRPIAVSFGKMDDALILRDDRDRAEPLCGDRFKRSLDHHFSVDLNKQLVVAEAG